MAEKKRRESLGRLLRLARPEWRTLALGTVFLALGSGMSLAFPQAIRIIIDGALAQKQPELVDQAALGLAAIFLVQAVAVAVRYYLFTTAGERVVARLRGDLFARLVEQEIAFFDARRTGELTNRLASDTTVLQNTVSVNISMALRNLAARGRRRRRCSSTPRRASPLLMLAVVPPVALGAVVYGRRVRKLSRDVQDALAAGERGRRGDALAGIRTVRSFAAENERGARYGQRGDALVRARADARRRCRGVFMGGASFAAYAAAALVLWYGGHLVARRRAHASASSRRSSSTRCSSPSRSARSATCGPTS